MNEIKHQVVNLTATENELLAAFSNIGADDKERRDFSTMIMTQLLVTDCIGRDYTEKANNIMQTIKNIKPVDHVEALLVVQMIATHNASMKNFSLGSHYISRNGIENIEWGNAMLNSANKLARTYTTQVEALSRYRNKGQQKMTVEHVHINAGGKAIIGNVAMNKND